MEHRTLVFNHQVLSSSCVPRAQVQQAHRNATMAVSSSTLPRVPQPFLIAATVDFFPSSEVWLFSGGGGGKKSPLLGSMQSPIHTEFVPQSMRT